MSLKFSRPGLVYTVFCGSRAEVLLRQFLLPDSVEGVFRTRSLISLKFSRPGLVYTVFCGSRAEVVLRQFLREDSGANELMNNLLL